MKKTNTSIFLYETNNETNNTNNTNNDIGSDNESISSTSSNYKNEDNNEDNNDDKNSTGFIDIYNTMTKDDISIQILKFIKKIEHNTKFDKRYSDVYDNICKDIITVPKFEDVLKLSIQYDEKCNLIEQIILLNSITPISTEFFDLKKSIIANIKKYANIKTTDDEYKKYNDIADLLNNTKEITHSVEHQILDMDIGDYDKAYIYNRYKSLNAADSSNSQVNNKLKRWIDCVINIPTKIKPMAISYDDTTYKKNKYLYDIKALLDKEIYGLETVKERILFLLNNRITNKESKGLNLALAGPPGTAKTSIINFLAKAVDLPFFQINTAGIKNSDFLLGHNFTYEGSGPGCIVQALHNLKYKNGIIYFDEFDKISITDHGLEISRALLHITDSSQNNKFHDHYIGEQFNIDLSPIWFAYSMNDANLIDPTLRDRISIIEIDGYTNQEKKIIASKYLLPKALKNIGLDDTDVLFNDASLDYLIELSRNTLEYDIKGKSGVRQLKHLIEEIMMKINLLNTITEEPLQKPSKLPKFIKPKKEYKLGLSFTIDNFKLPIIITKKIIDDLKIPQPKTNNHFSMYS